MKINPIVLSALAVAASSPSISAAPFPAGSGHDGYGDSVSSPQPNETLSPRADIGTFARRASVRGGQRRSSGKHSKDKQTLETDKKVKRDLLSGLTGGGGAPPNAEQAGYQSQVQSGLTGLGLGQVAGPVNGVLGTVGGLERSVQGTLNGLGLGAVNGVARSVLGTVNGLEDQIGATVKGLGLPEPLGSTVNHALTAAKGVQGQALSQLNVVPQGNNDGNQPQSQPSSDPLAGLGLSGILPGGLPQLSGLQGQLAGPLGGLGLSQLGATLPNLSGQSLAGLQTPSLYGLPGNVGSLAALSGLSQAQLASVGLGGPGNLLGQQNSQGGPPGLQNAANLANGLVGNTLSSAGGVPAPVRDAASSLGLPQSPLSALSDPNAIQKLLLSQSQEIAALEKMVQQQAQQLSAGATSTLPANVQGNNSPPAVQGATALTPLSAFGDTAKPYGVFDGTLYSNKMAVPGGEDSTPDLSTEDQNDKGSQEDPNPAPSSSAPAVVNAAINRVPAEWQSGASAIIAGSQDPTEVANWSIPSTLAPTPTNRIGVADPPSSLPDSSSNLLKPTGPMVSGLPPPIPAITSWGVKMAGSVSDTAYDMMTASAVVAAQKMSASDAYRTGAGATTLPPLPVPTGQSSSAAPAPPPSPTGTTTTAQMKKRSPKGDDSAGAEDMSGTALNPMVSDATATLQKYVSAYQGPESPAMSFFSAASNPVSPNLDDKAHHPRAMSPQMPVPVPDPDVGQLSTSREGYRLPGGKKHGWTEATYNPPSASNAGALKRLARLIRVKREDPGEEPDDENPEDKEPEPEEAQPSSEPEPEEDPLPEIPDTPVPLPVKPSTSEPAIHSKPKHHTNSQGEHTESHQTRSIDDHRRAMALTAATSPGGRPAMRRQQRYDPKHRKHSHGESHSGEHTDVHIHRHKHTESDKHHHYVRDESLSDKLEGVEAQIKAVVGKLVPKDRIATPTDEHAEHVEPSQTASNARRAKLRRRNAMPDLIKSSGAVPSHLSAHPPTYQAAFGRAENVEDNDPSGDGAAKKEHDREKAQRDKEKKQEQQEKDKETSEGRKEPAHPPAKSDRKPDKDAMIEQGTPAEDGVDEAEERGAPASGKLVRKRWIKRLNLKRWL